MNVPTVSLLVARLVFNYQLEGIYGITVRSRYALFWIDWIPSCMQGLGKTIQSIAFIAALE